MLECLINNTYMYINKHMNNNFKYPVYTSLKVSCTLKFLFQRRRMTLSTLPSSMRHRFRSTISFSCENTISEGALEARIARYTSLCKKRIIR